MPYLQGVIMNNEVQVFIVGKNEKLINDIKQSLNNRLGELVIFSSIDQSNVKWIDNKKTENIIIILHNFGISTRLKGYRYLLEILKDDMLSYFGHKIGEIYEMVGKKFNTGPINVERSIRHAIEVCWHRGDYYFIEKVFGHSINFEKNKPSNTELISTISEYISNHLILFITFILVKNMIKWIIRSEVIL